MSINDNGYNWYCDECGTLMNNQSGFTVENGQWTCTKCGAVNDVSQNNILPGYVYN